MQTDEAFYYKVSSGKLRGMVLLHVDDFLMSGDDKFCKETTEMFESHLTVSKVEDNEFRYCGLDIKIEETKLEVSMEEYTLSLEEWPVREGKKREHLNKDELKVFRKITGKISWLAMNCRPDLSHNSLKLSMRSRDATLQDLKYANASVRKAKAKVSKVSYKRVSAEGEASVYGISDASHKPGEKAVGGQFVVMGAAKTDVVIPLFWRSKLIQKVCKSPKDAETINLGIVADVACNFAKQIEEIMYDKKKKVETKIFTDSLGTLESIASSHQVERRNMRADVADLKQRLEL